LLSALWPARADCHAGLHDSHAAHSRTQAEAHGRAKNEFFYKKIAVLDRNLTKISSDSKMVKIALSRQ
jgi:hypothetical protein